MDELIEASGCVLTGVALGSNYYLDLFIVMSALYCQADFILGEDYTFYNWEIDCGSQSDMIWSHYHLIER